MFYHINFQLLFPFVFIIYSYNVFNKSWTSTRKKMLDMIFYKIHEISENNKLIDSRWFIISAPLVKSIRTRKILVYGVCIVLLLRKFFTLRFSVRCVYWLTCPPRRGVQSNRLISNSRRIHSDAHPFRAHFPHSRCTPDNSLVEAPES